MTTTTTRTAPAETISNAARVRARFNRFFGADVFGEAEETTPAPSKAA